MGDLWGRLGWSGTPGVEEVVVDWGHEMEDADGAVHVWIWRCINLREFGRINLIHTTCIGNVRSQPRATYATGMIPSQDIVRFGSLSLSLMVSLYNMLLYV